MYNVPARVNRNHDRLINAIDIDNYFNEVYNSSYSSNVFSLCEKINTLDIPNDMKYILSLENICHTYDKSYTEYDVDSIIERVTDYFLYNNLYENKTDLEKILETVSFKKKPDLSKAKELLKNFPGEKIKSKADVSRVISKFYALSKNNILDETPNFLAWIRKGIVIGTFAANPYIGAVTILVDYYIDMTVKRSETKKMISKLESEKNKIENKIHSIKDSKIKNNYEKYLDELEKNIDKIKDYEETLYSEKELDERDDDEMTFESTDVSNEQEPQYTFTIEEYFEKYHDLFADQIYRAKKELERLSNGIYSDYVKKNLLLITSAEELENFSNIGIEDLGNYLDGDKQVQYCIGQFLPYNLESYDSANEEILNKVRDILFDITENVSLVTDEMVSVYYDGNDDIYNIYVNLNVPISDAVQEHSMNIEMKKDLAMILALEEQVKQLSKIDTKSVFTYNDEIDFMNICENDIEFLCAFNTRHNNIFDQDILKESLIKLKKHIYENSTDEINKYKLGSAIQESIYQLSNPNKPNMFMKNRYQVLAECIDINESMQVLCEISATNSIKLAQQNLMKKAKTLSDKEKLMSRQMDNALDKFYNKVEKELTNTNREKVIKGTILPSASSIVKLALASGAAFMINPALAVITVLGSIALSKNGTKKEKQYILDEINIMLKMTDKKIQLAESNNDMKALEELLRTQQKLERERQRIHYNLRRRNYPVVASKRED